MLNVYGEAAICRVGDEAVWGRVNKELKTGAKYLSEYADIDDDRRGVAASRAMQTLLNYCI